MSGTNHVVGGTVFTGIFASFWNVNIFSEPLFLFFTAFFAILPDADHVKSPIGKAFYPIAKWLNTKYGHRTITHSLVFYVSGFFLVSFIESIFRKGDFTYTLIYGFAFFSHLLFDMMTKAGIPLFWPFKKNACVIPGNPELRLKSSDFQTEAICFGVFILLGITCQNLFAQGFWTTYNVQFNDLKHLSQEARMQENVLQVNYHFKTQLGKEMQGKGLLISHSENEALLFDKGFVQINSADKIYTVQPVKTNFNLASQDFLFYNISPDSLRKILKDKKILNLKLQCSQPFEFIKENQPTKSTQAALQNVFNPVFTFSQDSTGQQITKKIELINYELSKTLQEKQLYESGRRGLQSRFNQLTNSISQMDLYEREKATKELAELKQKLESESKAFEVDKLRLQLSHLQKELKGQSKNLISGYVQFIEFQ